jgi:hypothetical protein
LPSLLDLAHRSQASKKESDPHQDLIRLLLAMLSPLQRRFVLDPSRRKLARCGRRAGKSFMDAVYLILECLRAPNTPVLYAGLTRDSAKEIIWPTLLAIIDELGIAATPRPSSLMIEFANGSKITVFGCDIQNAKNRLRGRKFKLAIFDETAFYADIDSLIVAVMPMLADFGGTICLTSSPGELLSGLFYEADQGANREQWSRYEWTMHDNPFFQKPALDAKFRTRAEEELAFILDVEFKGDAQAPGYRREWLGHWVADVHALVYPTTATNRLEAPYKIPAPLHAIGIEMGSAMINACVVVRYSPHAREVQVVKAWKREDLELDAFASLVEAEIAAFEPVLLVAHLGRYTMDILEELKRRYKFPIAGFNDRDKSFHQKVFSNDLRQGYIKLVTPETLCLAEEYGKIVKAKDGDEIEGQSNAASNAALVVYRKIYQSHLANFVKPLSEEERMIQQLEAKRFEEPQPFYERLADEHFSSDRFGSDF